MATPPRLESTKIFGCKILHFDPFVDDRGGFQEAFNAETFDEIRLPYLWVQDNISTSRPNVIRGLHIQTDSPQGKLIRCLKGDIFDVCLDTRPTSATYGQHIGIWLNENRGLYLPPGTAHGFFSKTESVVYYKCTTLYDKASDGGINPFDPELGIDWPGKDWILSKKDMDLPSLKVWRKELER